MPEAEETAQVEETAEAVEVEKAAKAAKVGAPKPKRSILKRFVIAIAVILVASTAGFFIWASDYYHADDQAVSAFTSDATAYASGKYTVFAPDSPTDTAIIFYPGAKVECTAYVPILEKLKAQGYACILVKEPLNMAIFDVDAADDAFDLLPDVKHWYIAGHSMGGGMASSYAAKHKDRLDGLILLGAYVYGDYPPSDALTIYGSFNTSVEERLTYSDNVVRIEGGNHAQFGNYGKQKGDPDATISADDQQDQAVRAIVKFIENRQ